MKRKSKKCKSFDKIRINQNLKNIRYKLNQYYQKKFNSEKIDGKFNSFQNSNLLRVHSGEIPRRNMIFNTDKILYGTLDGSECINNKRKIQYEDTYDFERDIFDNKYKERLELFKKRNNISNCNIDERHEKYKNDIYYISNRENKFHIINKDNYIKRKNYNINNTYCNNENNKSMNNNINRIIDNSYRKNIDCNIIDNNLNRYINKSKSSNNIRNSMNSYCTNRRKYDNTYNNFNEYYNNSPYTYDNINNISNPFDSLYSYNSYNIPNKNNINSIKNNDMLIIPYTYNSSNNKPYTKNNYTYVLNSDNDNYSACYNHKFNTSNTFEDSLCYYKTAQSFRIKDKYNKYDNNLLNQKCNNINDYYTNKTYTNGLYYSINNECDNIKYNRLCNYIDIDINNKINKTFPYSFTKKYNSNIMNFE